MKINLVLAAALALSCAAGAETLDHWEITKVDNQAYISDGDWTFKASVRTWRCKDPATGQSIPGAPYEFNVNECTAWPSVVTALDFSKPLVNNSGDGLTYAIGSIGPVFGTDNGKYYSNRIGIAKESGDKVGALTFPKHNYALQIGGYAFAGCTNLVFDLKDLPTNTAFIYLNAFLNSSVSGSTPEMPYLTQLYAYSFMNCPGVTGFNAPNMINNIGECAFANDTALKTVVLGDYTLMGDSAFLNCSALESMTPLFSDSCKEIKGKAFDGCSSLTNAVVAKVTSAMVSDSGHWNIFHDCSKIPSVDYSQSCMKEIARAHFQNCSSVTILKLPATICQLASNPNGAFSGMTALRRLELHSSFNGYLNQFPAETTALREIHFYNCSPAETTSVLKDIATSQVVTTYLHDMTEEQLTAWAACTQDGVLSATSTWSSALAGTSAYPNRPLVVYAEQHAQIAAGANVVVLDGQNGSFTVSRGDDDPCAGDLVVNYMVSGEAVAGTHYVALSGSVTIPNGQSSATISVSGLYTGTAFEKGLTITLAAGDYTIIEGKANATISVIGGYRSVKATKLEDANKQLGKVGSFRISRGEGDSTAGELVVGLSYSGTAVNGTTYRELPTSVTIPAGSVYVDFEVFPLDDKSVTSDSTVIVTILDGLYTIEGDPATVNIVYGNGKWGCWHIYDDNGQKKITDGVWTFKCSLNGVLVSTGDAYRLDILEATAWPNEVSPLDFTKGFVNTFNNTTYKIGNWSMKLGTVENNDKEVAPTAAGDKVGKVLLSGGTHEATMQEKAFAGCTNMVFDLSTMPTNIVAIRHSAFQKSSATGALVAPYLRAIDQSAFRDCVGITSVKAPSITSIGSYAFQNATALKSFNMGPDENCALTSIGGSAFAFCAALESFTPFLPSSLDVVNHRTVFQNCANLTNALVFSGSNLCESDDWEGTETFLGCAKIPSADLSRSTITALRRSTFGNCSALEWVKLPPTIVQFGALTKPDNISLNANPFGGTSVKLYVTATNLPIHTMNIPQVIGMSFSTNLTTIADGAFSSTQYSGLTELWFTGAKPETIGSDLFAGQKASAITAWVPCEYLNSWRPVADDQIITHTTGTWTSGTTQQIHSYWLRKPGFGIIVK